MLIRTLAFAFVTLLFATPSYAGSFFVAGYGGVTSACSYDDPCSSFGHALSLATAGDTIICVAPPATGTFSITKSITIDCSAARAAIRDSAEMAGGLSMGVYINIPVSSIDPLRRVRLRGLDIDSLETNGNGHFDRGIEIEAAAVVYIEDCVIANVKQQGIMDQRIGGQTKLFIKDTVVSGNGGAGIVAISATVGITVLDNVTSHNNAYGIAVGHGNNVVIKNSVFSSNSSAGVEGDNGSQIVISNSTISHNNIGVQSSSSVRVYNNDISYNNTAFSGLAATMGLNRYSGNVSPGTAPSPVPNAPADIGP